MKRILCAILLAYCLAGLPWRLMGLFVQVMESQPGYVQVTTDDQGFWRAQNLQGQLEAWGWDVSYVNLRQRGLYGLTSPQAHTIQVDKDLHWSDRYAVLVHEAAHTLQPGWLDKDQEEVFAESVAALLDPHGMREHARYLSTRKETFMLTSLIEWPYIYAVAAVLR